LVSVPRSSRNALLLTFSVPVLLTPATRAVLPLVTATWPPEAVLKVPPLTWLPLPSTMLPPLMALSTPLAPWFNWVLAIVKLAPSPRISALLVAAPVVDSTMPALLLAIQEPLLTTASAPPAPI
jgi:hypothetical protein